MEDSNTQKALDSEDPRQKYHKLKVEIYQLQELLKRIGVYDDLLALFHRLCCGDTDYGRIRERFLEAWIANSGDPSPALIFNALLEVTREKLELERTLGIQN